jgi:hypothetical protein
MRWISTIPETDIKITHAEDVISFLKLRPLRENICPCFITPLHEKNRI